MSCVDFFTTPNQSPIPMTSTYPADATSLIIALITYSFSELSGFFKHKNSPCKHPSRYTPSLPSSTFLLPFSLNASSLSKYIAAYECTTLLSCSRCRYTWGSACSAVSLGSCDRNTVRNFSASATRMGDRLGSVLLRSGKTCCVR